MSLKNKSVLVTGGAGFIGSHLVDSLISQEPEGIAVVDNFFLGKRRKP
jgi:UDP-glucose 4-epimerase